LDADKSVTVHYSESVVFPDADLEAAVRSAIGKPDGNIHVAGVQPLARRASPSPCVPLAWVLSSIRAGLWRAG